MKMFAVLMAMITVPSFAAIIDGCYKTVAFNGEPVTQGPDEEKSLSRIYSKTSPYYFDSSYKNINTKIISVFKGYNEGWYSSINPLVFEDMGITEESDNSWAYYFAGDVFYTDTPYVFQKTDFQTNIEFKWTAEGLLAGEIYQLSYTLEREYHFQVLLEKAVCPVD